MDTIFIVLEGNYIRGIFDEYESCKDYINCYHKQYPNADMNIERYHIGVSITMNLGKECVFLCHM